MKIYNVYSKSNSELVGTIYADSINDAIQYSHKNGYDVDNHIIVEQGSDGNDEYNTLKLKVYCQAYYDSSIKVPKELSLEKAIQYAKEHIDDIELGSLYYIPDSDDIDGNNLEDFELIENEY